MSVVDVLLIIALAVSCLAGVLLTLFQLPGTWLIVLLTAGYAWHYGWERIGITMVLVIFGLAAVAEAAESLSAMYMAQRGGASRRAVWYGFFGGLAGALLLTIPVPLIGTIVGAALGCFLGTFLAELSLSKRAADGVRVGAYAALGRTLGSMVKLMLALVMTGLAVGSALTGLP